MLPVSVKPCPHCHRKRRLSQKSVTVGDCRRKVENGEKTATVVEFGLGDSRTFCDSRRFRRQIVAEIGDSVDSFKERFAPSTWQWLLGWTNYKICRPDSHLVLRTFLWSLAELEPADINN